jgi:hypothetical protein
MRTKPSRPPAPPPDRPAVGEASTRRRPKWFDTTSLFRLLCPRVQKTDKHMSKPVKVAYLFGAGATHAEIVNLYPQRNDEIFLKGNGLLMHHVSKRVCEAAAKEGLFDKRIGLLSPAGLSNIELFISLIENNVINSEQIILRLKRSLRNDILSRLSASRLKQFYLHKALLELHKNTGLEVLLGIISLNYDHVLDEAYETISGEPNYCLTSASPQDKLPLLKLHGGFHLKYRNHALPIITPGINKNYLELPYNFVWGRALEILIECDILRVIGCSLSHNDIGLVDLLFKAHLAKKSAFQIQMIDFDPDNNKIQAAYGFLPELKRALQIESGLISDESIKDYNRGSNPFKIWLKAKITKMLTADEIKGSEYLKKVLK